MGHLTFQVLLVELNSQPLLFKSLCTFGSGYCLEHIGFESSFKFKSGGSVFQVPSVP